MSLNMGIVGLPNVGKSTLFNALTNSKGAEAQNYPFCTIDPNVGIVEVPDERLDTLASLASSAKVIPASIEFVDIAGLVKGAHKGEGLGNQFLAAIREVDAICQVIRYFSDDNITHVDGDIDPVRDRETIETELALADLDMVEKFIDKTKGAAKTGNKESLAMLSVLETLLSTLSEGKLATKSPLSEDDWELIKSVPLLTSKPLLYALNVSEEQLSTLTTSEIRSILGVDENTQVVAISAKIEEDLHELSGEDKNQLLSELGVESSGLERLIKAAYSALGYITYFTAGEKEARAWNIPEGFTAPQAAGVIHTDFERGFICAEVIAYSDYSDLGSEQKAKEAGKLRQEGKGYVVADGDVIHFRFNV